MVKKFYIVSCAALVACLCFFAQDAGATARQSEATTLAPGASAGATIRRTQLAADTAQKPPRKAKKLKKKVKRTKKEGTPRKKIPLSISIGDYDKD